MPSDPRTDRDALDPPGPENGADERLSAAHSRLAKAGEDYRAALSSALEEARGVLGSLRSAGNGRAARITHELGAMAMGPVDPAEFTALLDPGDTVDPTHLQRFEEAVATLEWALAEAPGVLEVDPAGGISLRDAVARALSERGRAFGAARVVALLRAGTFSEEEHGGLFEGLPFPEWRSLERSLAPPLVVSVEGCDLATAVGLAQFLDGRQKIVLLVRGRCPPAPLARLIAPGLLVLQATEVEELSRLATFPGPAVAALVPDTAALFVHEPSDAGKTMGELELQHLPENQPRSWIGGMSPGQQAAELHILEAWSRRLPPAGTEAAEASTGTAEGPPDGSSSPASDPAERLAAWLVSQADLKNADGG